MDFGAPIPSELSDRRLLEMIWAKMATMDVIKEKLDSMDYRLTQAEDKIKMLDDHFEELHKGTEFIETEFQSQKELISEIKNDMVTKEEFQKLQMEVIDQSNRMRRKNVVFYNIPEGEEKGNCTTYIQNLVKKIDNNAKIETAHRSPSFVQAFNEKDSPRPIHALCVTRDDRELILDNGPKYLKVNLIGDKKIYVSDDVHPKTREIHKQLLMKQKEFRSKGLLAYIPWRVPQVLKYRPGPKGSNVHLKTYRIQ